VDVTWVKPPVERKNEVASFDLWSGCASRRAPVGQYFHRDATQKVAGNLVLVAYALQL
jgi:hypothetical protein